MTAAVLPLLGDRLSGGAVVGPVPCEAPPRLRSFVGEHPRPGPGSEAAGRSALEIARRASSHDLLLVLLSGGASALMAQPADGITLGDKRQTTDALLRAGADIHALNTVRKHLSSLKGGQLAAATPSTCLTLAVSDVVGDDLGVIGSGPTVADGSTFAEARAIVGAAGLEQPG